HWHHRAGARRQDPAARVHRPGRFEGQRGGIVMARVPVQRKLRLLANALRSSNRAKASFMTSTAFAVLTALGMFALLASLHGQSTAVSLPSFMFTVFAFGWLILPLLAFGLDSTLDPATVAPTPLATP